MSYAEFGRHIDYLNKYGRCSPVRMFDRGPALIASRIDQLGGVESSIKDHLPFYQEPEVEAGIADVIKFFGGPKPRGD